VPIERLEDAAQGIWASLQGEKCQLDRLILIAKQSLCTLWRQWQKGIFSRL